MHNVIIKPDPSHGLISYFHGPEIGGNLIATAVWENDIWNFKTNPGYCDHIHQRLDDFQSLSVTVMRDLAIVSTQVSAAAGY